MKTIYSVCLLLLSGVLIAQSNYYLNLNQITIQNRTNSYLYFNNFGNTYMEPPPVVVAGGWHSYYFTTHFTRFFSSPTSITQDNLEAINMSTAYGGTIVSSSLNWWNGYRPPAQVPNEGLQWRRDYNGIFGAHAIQTSEKGNIIVAYEHGENKNGIMSNNYYNNTVWPEKPIDLNNKDSYSGYVNGVFNDGWLTYFAFVSLAWIENTNETHWGDKYFWEEGPIAWPSNGYLTADRKKASMGLRHPSSMIYGNYVYVFFVDTRSSDALVEEGRSPGIKVVRAPVNEAWNYRAYQVYYNGGWQSSLPAGYSKESMQNYFTTKGPKSTPLFVDASHEIIRFSVAKITNADFFLGMEEYNDANDNNKNKVAFRISNDLVNWSSIKYMVSSSSDWGTGSYHYPIFIDKDGWTNSAIDMNNFYVLGTKYGQTNGIYRAKFDIDIGVPPIGPGGGVIRSSDNSMPENSQATEQQDVHIQTFQNNSVLHVLTNENSLKKKVFIYSVYGKLITQKSVEGNQSTNFDLEIDIFPAKGIYIMVIDTGRKKYTKKLFIQ